MMRTINWLFLISVLLFVFAVGFVIAAGRTLKASPVAATGAAAPATPAIATVKQVMRGITMPSAQIIWDSVSTIVDARGTTENAPKTDADWAVVGANAAALAESANMLMAADRAVDKENWMKFATALRDSAMTALKAAETKDAPGVLAVGEVINASCDACHERYQRN